MNVTIFLRVAQGARGPRVAASTAPNYYPLESGSGWSAKPLPTAAFALRLVIPDEAFERAAQILASVTVPDDDIEVAVDVDHDDERILARGGDA